ncbi:MAG: PH domain-containing protein [bacterium]|nr:PH domain-containing protein [bacterium]MBK7672460.1 PH domain-containing protein [bacterium]
MTRADLPAEVPPTVSVPAVAPAPGNDYLQLDPRHVTHGRMVGAVSTGIIAMVLSMALAIVFLVADGLAPAGRLLCAGVVVLVIAASGALAWSWPAAVHAHTTYRHGRDGLEISRGVWWRRVSHVPRSRIQHTDVSQGPLERRFGLATLRVFTAGTENAEVALAGLAHETATAIRDQLLAGTDDDVV